MHYYPKREQGLNKISLFTYMHIIYSLMVYKEMLFEKYTFRYHDSKIYYYYYYYFIIIIGEAIVI